MKIKRREKLLLTWGGVGVGKSRGRREGVSEGGGI